MAKKPLAPAQQPARYLEQILDDVPLFLALEGKLAIPSAKRTLLNAFLAEWERMAEIYKEFLRESLVCDFDPASESWGKPMESPPPFVVSVVSEVSEDGFFGIDAEGRTVVLHESELEPDRVFPVVRRVMVALAHWFDAPRLVVDTYEPSEFKRRAQELANRDWSLADLIEAAGGNFGNNANLAEALKNIRLVEAIPMIPGDASSMLLRAIADALIIPRVSTSQSTDRRRKKHTASLYVMAVGDTDEWPDQEIYADDAEESKAAASDGRAQLFRPAVSL